MHDTGRNGLIVSNSGDTAVEITDFSEPIYMIFVASFLIDTFDEEVTSVSVINSIVAVAVRHKIKRTALQSLWIQTVQSYLSSL